MSFLVCHMQKFKLDDLRGVTIHNERLSSNSSNKDIDYSRTALNFDAINQERGLRVVNYRSEVENVLKLKLGDNKSVRKDAVRLVSVLVSSDNEFFKNLPTAQQKEFFRTASRYLSEEFGPDNVIAAKVHMDETTPHMHFAFVPLTDDGRLCAKEIINRQRLRQVQDELPKVLQKAGFNIQRGIENSPAKHLAEKEFKSITQISQKSIDELSKIINSLQSDIKITRAGLLNSTKVAKMPVDVCEKIIKIAKESIRLRAENEKLARYYAPDLQENFNKKLKEQEQIANLEKAGLKEFYQKSIQGHNKILSNYVLLQKEIKRLKSEYQELYRAIPINQRENILQKIKKNNQYER